MSKPGEPNGVSRRVMLLHPTAYAVRLASYTSSLFPNDRGDLDSSAAQVALRVVGAGRLVPVVVGRGGRTPVEVEAVRLAVVLVAPVAVRLTRIVEAGPERLAVRQVITAKVRVVAELVEPVRIVMPVVVRVMVVIVVDRVMVIIAVVRVMVAVIVRRILLAVAISVARLAGEGGSGGHKHDRGD